MLSVACRSLTNLSGCEAPPYWWSASRVPVATDMAEQLREVIAGRPVYVHIDCDVLAPGTVPTDYLVPGGVTLAQLRDCAAVLAESEVVGIEVGELEAVDPSDPSPARLIVEALAPLLDRAARGSGN